jgi:type I restriction enzyme R subunit
MTTGVDAQTCKLIVLDQRIQSMTEFKQIIGRGTRINDDYNKHWFTILDFKKATELFADPKFDGDPVKVYQPKGDDPINPDDELDETDTDAPEHGCGEEPEGYEIEPGEQWETDDPDWNTGGPGEGGEQGGGRTKYVVGDVEVTVIAERVQYLGADGKLITESLKDYTRKKVKEQFASLDEFLRRWNETDRKQAIIDELGESGIFWEDLIKEVSKKLGAEADPFDVICHIVYDQPPLSRKEPAAQVRKNDYFSKYEGASRQVLDALLDKYTDSGIETIEDVKVLTLAPFSQIGAPMELLQAFGGRPGYTEAVKDLEDALYQQTS